MSTAFREDIQGIRAIAVAIVVLAHADVSGFSGGYVGVDVFFIISGFLITRLLVEEYQASGSVNYGHFLTRRLRRLLPALLFMLVTVQIVSRLALSKYEALMQTGSLIYAATWTSNLYFAFTEFDYFANLQTKDLYLHTWSLGVEEQFYLLWPLLIIFAVTVHRGQSKSQKIRAIILAFFLVMVSSLCLLAHWNHTNSAMSFYMMPARAWQFALGALTYLASVVGTNNRRPAPTGISYRYLMQVGGFIGLALIASSTLLLHEDLVYPSYYVMAPSIGTALILYSSTGDGAPQLYRLLSSRPLVWLGNRSYSIYLFHWPALIIGGAYGLDGQPVNLALLLIAILVISSISYRLFELPFWKGKYSHTQPRPAALLAALSVVLVVGASHTLVADIFTRIPSSLYDYQSELRPPVQASFVMSKGCDSWHFNARVVPCSTDNPDAQNKVVIIGDSMAANWAAALPEIYAAPNWQVILLTKSACAIVDVDYFYAPARGVYEICREWREASIEYINSLQPDIVFILNSAYYEFTDTQWLEGTNSVLSSLSIDAGSVVLIPGTPAISFHGPSCASEPYRFAIRLPDAEKWCSEELNDDESENVAGVFQEAAREKTNVHALVLADLVCPQGQCAAMNEDGVLVFHDEVHLTAGFVNRMVPEIRQRLEKIGLGPSSYSKH